MPRDLAIVAGMPNEAVRELRKRWRSTESDLVAVASPSRSRTLYNQQVRGTLVSQASRKALRRVAEMNRKATAGNDRGKSRDPAPDFIGLLYVPAADSAELLRQFDYFVMPHALPSSVASQAQEDWSRAVANIQMAWRRLRKSESYRSVKAEVPSNCNSALKLPPTNFSVRTGGASLAAHFRQIQHEQLAPAELRKKLKRRRLPDDPRRSFVDARKLYYPRDRQDHGGLRTSAAIVSRMGIEELQYQMNGLYRFGFPLPTGAHFDVQKERGRLRSEHFVCARAGDVYVTGTHANIYPNDFVRWPEER